MNFMILKRMDARVWLIGWAVMIGSFIAPISVLAAERNESFHAPMTQAEKALDTILTQANLDDTLFEFVLKRPWYDASKGSGYMAFFTPALLNELASREAFMVQENCGGNYRSGEICGFDYNPISCTQDAPSTYYYITQSETQQKAIVLSADSPMPKEASTYVLVKQNGRWKIDGIECGIDRFNMR